MGYLLSTSQEVVASLTSIQDQIILVKDIKGNIYFPDASINQIGELRPGQGYQIKFREDVPLTYTTRAGVNIPQPRSVKRAFAAEPNCSVT